jgi:hypothetical protein
VHQQQPSPQNIAHIELASPRTVAKPDEQWTLTLKRINAWIEENSASPNVDYSNVNDILVEIDRLISLNNELKQHEKSIELQEGNSRPKGMTPGRAAMDRLTRVRNVLTERAQVAQHWHHVLTSVDASADDEWVRETYERLQRLDTTSVEEDLPVVWKVLTQVRLILSVHTRAIHYTFYGGCISYAAPIGGLKVLTSANLESDVFVALLK